MPKDMIVMECVCVRIRGDSRTEKRFFTLARNLTLEFDEDRRSGVYAFWESGIWTL